MTSSLGPRDQVPISPATSPSVPVVAYHSSSEPILGARPSSLRVTFSKGLPNLLPKPGEPLLTTCGAILSRHPKPSDSVEDILKIQEKYKEDNDESLVEKFKKATNKEMREEIQKEAFRRLQEIFVLGGLSRTSASSDIPFARRRLCQLIEIESKTIRSLTLDILIMLLQSQLLNLTPENAFGLQEDLSRLADRITLKFEEEIRDLQVKFAQSLGLMAELILRHQRAVQISGITEGTKAKLRNASSATNNLNIIHDLKLLYYSRFAREAIVRIVSDEKIVYDMVYRFYNIGRAAACVWADDPDDAFQALKITGQGLSKYYRQFWFDGAYNMRTLAIAAAKEPKETQIFTDYIKERASLSSWKFTYCAADTISLLVLKSKTDSLRLLTGKNQVEENKIFNPNEVSLASLGATKGFKSDKGHLEAAARGRKSKNNPNIINQDPNAAIRERCIDHLYNISLNNENEITRKEANYLIIGRLALEENLLVKNLIKKILPSKANWDNWAEEKSNFKREDNPGFSSFSNFAALESEFTRNKVNEVMKGTLNSRVKQKCEEQDDSPLAIVFPGGTILNIESGAFSVIATPESSTSPIIPRRRNSRPDNDLMAALKALEAARIKEEKPVEKEQETLT